MTVGQSALASRSPAAAALVPAGWSWHALGLAQTTLANGLTVVLAENHAVPLLFLSWNAEAGFDADPPSLEGIASMMPSVLREGTMRRDATRIAGELDDLGAELATGTDWDRAFLNIALLSRDLAQGLDLLFDLACAPRIQETVVARQQAARLAALDARRRAPMARAQDALATALFGGSTYGRPTLGDAASVRRIDAAAMTAFHAARYRPAQAALVIAGSFDADRTLALIEAHAQDLPSRPRLAAEPRGATPEPASAAPAPCEPAFDIVDMPEALQTEICVGTTLPARDSEMRPALELLAAVLGGGPASRLARSLRARAGLTYHVHSLAAARRAGGLFTIVTTVAHDSVGAVLDTIGRELTRLTDECISEAEIEQARRRMLTADLRLFQDLIGIGATLGGLALAGDPAAQLERRRQALDAIEPHGLRELARRYLAPERMRARVAGPAARLSPRLAADVNTLWERPASLPTRS